MNAMKKIEVNTGTGCAGELGRGCNIMHIMLYLNHFTELQHNVMRYSFPTSQMKRKMRLRN